MGKLLDIVSSFTTSLDEVAGYFNQAAQDLSNSDMVLGLWVGDLCIDFTGVAAKALNTTVSDYQNASGTCQSTLTDAANALATCMNTLQNDTQYYEAQLSDPYGLLPQVLQVSLENIANSGGIILCDNVNAAATQWKDNYCRDNNIMREVDPEEYHKIQAMDVTGNLLDVLQQWGDDVKSAIDTLNSSLDGIKIPQIHLAKDANADVGVVPGATPIAPIDTVTSTQFALMIDPNMQNLVNLIFSHYGDQDGTHPFGITQIGPKPKGPVLVTIAGLEFSKWLQSNSALGAVETGLLEKYGSTYANQIYTALQQYLHDNGYSSSTQVILAGHSQGGMAAQLVAQMNEENHHPFNITNVITFGSPPMYDPKSYSDVSYTMYRDASDPVPSLSTYNITNLGAPEKGETLVPDVGNVNFSIIGPYEGSWDPTRGWSTGWFQGAGVAHGEYVNSAWLGDQHIPFSVGYYGPTKDYLAPMTPDDPAFQWAENHP